MHFDEKLLHKLEKLSLLKINEDKKDQILSQLSEIVGFIENLNELDLSSQKSENADTGTPFRQDELNSCEVITEVFKHAPLAQDGFFIVPKIIE